MLCALELSLIMSNLVIAKDAIGIEAPLSSANEVYPALLAAKMASTSAGMAAQIRPSVLTGQV
jgi:hypothetical protein